VSEAVALTELEEVRAELERYRGQSLSSEAWPLSAVSEDLACVGACRGLCGAGLGCRERFAACAQRSCARGDCLGWGLDGTMFRRSFDSSSRGDARSRRFAEASPRHTDFKHCSRNVHLCRILSGLQSVFAEL